MTDRRNIQPTDRFSPVYISSIKIRMSKIQNPHIFFNWTNQPTDRRIEGVIAGEPGCFD